MINHLDKEGGRLAVSVEDAAAMVGIGRTTLYAALGDRSLRSLKIGKRRLIPIDALKAWIAAHEEGCEPGSL